MSYEIDIAKDYPTNPSHIQSPYNRLIREEGIQGMHLKPRRLLQEGLLVTADRLPDKAVLISHGSVYTYAELLDNSLRLASGLHERGVRRGDRVAIYMENGWACVVSIFGALLAGGVVVVINPQTKADKLRYVIDDSDAAALLADAQLSANYLPILPVMPQLRAVICAGEEPTCSTDFSRSLEAFDGVIRDNVPMRHDLNVIPNDLAALIYTSGSTGNPKGVMQTQSAMVFALGSLIEYLRLVEDDRIINVLPLAFDYGLYQLLMAVDLGATLILEKSFGYPGEIIRRIEEEQVTVLPGVPTVFAMLISLHRRSPICLPPIKRVTNTAAALPADYVFQLRQIFPEALIYLMYGLTECKRVSYLLPELAERKPTSVGEAIPGTEVFLLSPEGESVPPGEAGILHVRGPHVMAGYWKSPELSAVMLKEGSLPGERILCTHDWFRMDEEGYLYFVGRSDDIIKIKGEKASPVEVENVICGIPGVREAAVVGVPDKVLGSRIRAYVVREDGADIDEKDIKAVCKTCLENILVPQEVVFIAELPKTVTGKVSRRRLLEAESTMTDPKAES